MNIIDIGFILIAIIGVVAILWACGGLQNIKHNRENEKLKNYWVDRYKKWLKLVDKHNNYISDIYSMSNLYLDENESCLYAVENAELFKPTSVGKYGGVSIPVVAGITVHTGGFQDESQLEWRFSDRGYFCLTDKRLIFLSNMKTYDIKIENILVTSFGLNFAKFYIGKKCETLSGNEANNLYFSNIDGIILENIFNTLNNKKEVKYD